MRALLCFLLATIVQQSPPRDRPATVSSAGGVVSGRVFAEATGAPIPGAIVALMASSSSSTDTWSVWSPVGFARSSGRMTSTDVAGTFLIAGVEPGEYRLVARPGVHSERYLRAAYGAVGPNDPGRLVVVRKGEPLQGLDIALPSGVAVEGRVVDEHGEPLALMPVVAARILPGSDAPQRVSHPPASTDDLGRYRLFGLEPGDYILSTESSYKAIGSDGRETSAKELPGFPTTFHPSATSEGAAQRVRLTAGRDASGIDIQAVRARLLEVSGTLLDSRGVPASTTNVLISRDGVSSAASHSFYTDAAGRFRAAAVQPGNYQLVVGRGGAVNGRVEFADVPLTVAGDIEGLILSTTPGVVVSGRVVLVEGQALDVGTLRITLERAGAAVRSIETIAAMDADRRFRAQDVFGPHMLRIAGLPSGSTVKAVLLRGDDITDVPTTFRAEDADQLQVVISSRASTLEGTVRGEGTSPPGDATVYVFGEDRSTWRMSSPRTHKSAAAADGKFSVGGLSAGRYYAIAVAREGLRMPQKPGEAFFDLLSRDATPFAIGDDERRPLELRLWRWPE